MSWTANNNQTGIFVAQKMGWYKDAGIDLEVLPYSGQRPTEVIAAGAADAGDTNAEAVINAAINQIGVTMVHNTQQKPSYGILLKADKAEVTRPRDLDGLTYADWGSATIRAQVQDMIKNDGGKGDFKTVNLAGPDAYTALNEGRVDFTTGFVTVEGERAKLNGTPYKTFAFDNYDVPANPADIGIVLSNNFIEKHPKATEAFTQATQKGYDFALNHPEEAAQILLEANPDAHLDPELVKKTQISLSAAYWKDHEGVTGHADLRAWQDYINYLQKKELLHDATGAPVTAALSANDMVTNRYLK
ncbi:hypothetical protein BM477_06515 [Boudabousia marimammalium]|uniref:Thiamine pyrimidine synthase n=2 Tax=Boudabousia marimammalium TaxID=156892 RepID=A0A1Q5PM33_9ACTO|nr:hypothetical protein BM477_06515 [Boudabousia marimammalium]